MNSESIDAGATAKAILEAIGDEVPRNCAAWASREAVWVSTVEELADHCAANGLAGIGRRLRRVLVPAGHVAVVIVDSEVSLRIIDLRDKGLEDEEEEPEPKRGANALSPAVLALEANEEPKRGTAARVLGAAFGGGR